MFRLESVKGRCFCSECHHVIAKGEDAYVSRNKKGVVMKRVCSEQCGQTYDYREMREQARRRAAGESLYQD